MKWTIIVSVVAVVIVAIGVVYALAEIGFINISYRIVPTTQPPTMNPSSVSLDLGEIPSGSFGTKDFGKVATLNLPANYEITFILDTETVKDFVRFTVYIKIYEGTDLIHTVTLYDYEPWNEESVELEAGTYDIYVSVEYEASSVTGEKTGAVLVTIYYPG